MKHIMPIAADQRRLYAAVASLPCQICGKDGVQVSHSNQSKDGKGMGLKAHSWRVAALCMTCHVRIDSGQTLSRAERVEAWDSAHRATLGELFRLGLVRPV